MSSAQVMEKFSPENEVEHKSRPSALGHFLARIGSTRHRSKSPRDPSFSQKDTVAPCTKHHTWSAENGTKSTERTLSAENELHLSSPPPKPKRHSSPFVRIIHRLSMNRKTREEPISPTTTYNCSEDLDQSKFNSSRESVYSTSSPSTAFVPGTDVLSRPAVSENDLRFVTLRKDQEMERSVTALFVNTNGIHSDDDLHVITRVPSYLRISCALNGYRRPYRRLEDSRQWLNVTPKKLPMSIVETRTLAFTQNNGGNQQKSVKSEKALENRNNSQMEDAVSRTSAPVRQLVAHFDRMHESTAIKTPDDSGMKLENAETEFSHRDGNTGAAATAADETHTTTPLEESLAPQNSIAVSDRLYGSPYSHTSPKPSVAHRMHLALLKTTMESKPNASNQAEVRIENGQVTAEQVAEKVKNENSINFTLPDGETYRNLLMKAKAGLKLHCEEAENDLEKEEDLPENAAGALRTAIGKANLLVDKKMTKFEELVKIHLDQDAHEAPQVTLSDLSGYWALISIEVKELEDQFRAINALRGNNWVQEEQEMPSVVITSENRGDGVKRMRPASPVLKSEKMALEAQRRHMALAEAKRRQKELMKAQEQQFAESDDSDTARMVI